MAARWFANPGGAHGDVDGAVDDRLVKVVAPALTGQAIDVETGRHVMRMEPPHALDLTSAPAEQKPRSRD